MTLIAFITQEEINKVSAILNENGYEGRYEWTSSLDEDGNMRVMIHEDYEDLPGLFEILNSEGIQLLDNFKTESSLYQSYHLENKSDCEDVDKEFIPIPIPAHFIQDPIEDQLY